LQVKLSGDEKARLAARPTDNLEAYELFVRARDLVWRGDPAANLEARRLFSEAIALDDHFADAVALLGFTYMLDIVSPCGQSHTAVDTAGELGERSIALDASRAYPHFLMSSVHLWRREFDEALAAEARCRALDPNFPQGRAQRGFILHYVGRSTEAIDEFAQAMRLDPLMPDTFLHSLAQCHFALGDDEEAARVLRRRITIKPGTDISRVLLAAALGHLGRYEEARHEWERARAINPSYSLRQKRAILPYRDPAVLDRMAEGLAKAGIDPD
jgi:tetratricopeptide (TPR) repeat protein